MTTRLKITLLFLVSTWGALALHAAAAEKKIYAHYMGCYPAGYGPTELHRRNQWKEMKHDSADYQSAVGGRITNWPLVPQDQRLSPAQDAELEIRRAIRGGIDGFAVDAWAGQDMAKAVLDELFAAAERIGQPFELTVCLDPACHEKRPVGNHLDTYTETLRWLLDKHGQSPHLARRNDKPLIFGYGSSSIIFDPAFRALPETPEKWARISDAYRQLEKNVGRPLYFHFCFDNLGAKEPAIRLQAAAWAGKNFDAVGGFLGNGWDDDATLIAAINAGGAEWAQPVYHQYNNKSGSNFSEPGTDKLRRAYEKARRTGSTLIQFVTWNDYGEDTVLAPGYSTNYTILSLHRYLADWWKQGREPVVEKDQVHLIYRRALNGAISFPFQTRRLGDGVLEIATILTRPGVVSVPGYNLSYEAPAGLSVRQVPLRTGKVGATLSRGGREVLSVTAPEETSDSPFREDNAMVCFSSDFLDEWKTDFGEAPPLLYSEYGDSDGDGLPNWFEMYWFGKFPDLATATGAGPKEDPDGDGRTNLEEFRARTNPLKAAAPYAPGFVWDVASVQQRGISFNPDRDANERDVWFYYYKHGEAGDIAHDGDYVRMASSWMNVPYAGKMAHLSPAKDPDGLAYRYLHGWIAHRKTADDRWQMVMRPRANVAVILGWQSPVSGAVRVSFDVAEVAGTVPIVLQITRNAEPRPLRSDSIPVGGTANVELGAIAVKKGDFLYLVADADPRSYDSPSAWLENLKITLEKAARE